MRPTAVTFRRLIPIDWIVVAFWASLLVPVLSYAVYPLTVVVLARSRAPTASRDVLPWPTVAIAIAAHNEEQTIERAVRSALAQEYPGASPDVVVGLDGCTDATGEILARIDDPRLRVLTLSRAGKASTDNRLVAALTAEVVVTTSAGAEFAPEALTRLVAPLRDPSVGCVTGVFQPRTDGTSASRSEGHYWRLEYAVMAAESNLGILSMASGTALAFRRELFETIPTGSDADVVVAPRIVARGYRAVHVPNAIVYDDGPSTLPLVLRNRRRMALRALPATAAIIPRLIAAGRLDAAIGLMVHKLFRWVTPVAAVVGALAGVVLVAVGDDVYTRLVATGLTALAAATGVALIRGPQARGALMSFAVAQVAFALAIVDIVRGRRAQTWTRGAG